MDLGTALSAAEALVSVLKSEELKYVCSLFGYESQVYDLQATVSTIKAVLLDAETKELSCEANLYIQELKDAVYDADDLIDEFLTLVKKKQFIKGGKATKKVRLFFSRYNPLGVAYNMSHGVKKIRTKLDAIANNHAHFGFNADPQPMRLTRDETCSYVYEGSIVGRDDDVNDILGDLLSSDSNAQQNVSFLTIVGIGGVGKTTLAQLVYNNARVTSAFPLRIWTCVSDHHQERLDIEQVLQKILTSYSDEKHEGLPKDSVQRQLRERLLSKKYLLVLDDVWTENRNQWNKLVEFLLGGQKGSWIVVTTRSHETAKIIGDGTKYELQGLSKENSWCLFKKMAFGSEQSTVDVDLLKLGREIVEGCVGVPLAIRVAGSLLYGQDKNRWLAFLKSGLSNFRQIQDIIYILKLSYHQLESPLKSCFTYCSLFPKDFIIERESLISLWLAQGYVVPLHVGQTVEDAAEEYFSILLQRCFFQDVLRSDGKIISCKMHDLMHDLAQNVAGNEICVAEVAGDNLDKRVRHLAYIEEFAHYSIANPNIRSYIYVGKYEKCFELELSTLEALLANCTCLRALDLSGTGLRKLPNSIGKLLHLRYLDLSNNKQLEVLPKSINKLYNLQTLKIGGCLRLKKLPKDFQKLVNLRVLEISNCGIRYVTCLGAFQDLKILRLISLSNLEYIVALIENRMMTAEGVLCCPHLEELQLRGLDKMKGWKESREEVKNTWSRGNMTPLLFTQLKSLEIKNCREMTCYFLCPNLECLYLEGFNENLQVNDVVTNEIGDKKGKAVSSSSTNLSYSYGIPKLKRVSISNVGWLNKMSSRSFYCLETLVINFDNNVESLEEVGEVFRSCSSGSSESIVVLI